MNGNPQRHVCCPTPCCLHLLDPQQPQRLLGSLLIPLSPFGQPQFAPCLPLQGRIFVLAAAGGKFNVVCEKETRGAVYALTEFQGRLLAGINSRVQMYK